MGRVEYGTDGRPYKFSMSTRIENTEQYPTVEAILKKQYENRLTTDMATIKQLSNSVKILQKANSEIAGAYDKLKSDYENRLKADLVAILTEIQLEIEELPTKRMAITDSSGLICYGYSEHKPTAKDVSKIIQQKINLLKENENGDK